MTNGDTAAKSFWKFSLAFYAAPGVAPACLAVQDRHGLDVNLALYCCWLGLSGRGAIGSAELAAADTAIAAWRRRVVAPLRRVRRALKRDRDPAAAALLERIKALELESERLCQARLAALAPPPRIRALAVRRRQASANLALYLGGEARAAGAPIFAALSSFAGRAR